MHLWALVVAPALATPAAADEGRLTWDVPAECGSRGAFEARVARLLGRPIGSGLPADRGFDVRVSVIDERFRLTVSETGTDEAARELASDDCASLVDAAAIVVALRIDPQAVARLERSPEPVQNAPVADEGVDGLSPPPAPAPLDVRSPAEPATPIVLGATAGGGAAFHLLPATSPALAASLSAGWGPWRAGLAGWWVLPQTAAQEGHPGAGAELELLTVVVHGCFTPIAGAIHTDACLGLHLGSLVGQGVGLEAPRQQVAAWIAGEALVRGRVLLGTLFELGLAVGAVLPFNRPDFVIERAGTVYRPPAVGLRADLSLGIRLFP